MPLDIVTRPLLMRAEQRRADALSVLDALQLMERWRSVGSPVLVGAVDCGLVVKHDIDIEVYSHRLSIEEDFRLMSAVAALPQVNRVTFVDDREGEDRGLYWGIGCSGPDGNEWNVDLWHVTHSHPDAHWCERFADAIEPFLTDSARATILRIKERTLDTSHRGVDVYRAVLEGGVQDEAGYYRWYERHREVGMVHWLPGAGQ